MSCKHFRPAHLWNKSVVSALAALIVSGCMTSPHNGKDVGKSTDPVEFYGYVDKPGQTVTIQARKKDTDNWTTIATTVSKTHVIHYGDSKLYFWSIKKVVPKAYWFPQAYGTENSGVTSYRETLVRAITEDRLLATFEVADMEYLVDPDVPAADLWEDYGYSSFVRITADWKHPSP